MSSDPWQRLNFFPEPDGHGSLRPGAGALLSCRSPPLRGAASEPVSVDVAGGGGNPIYKRLMPRYGILVRVNQSLQAVPAALGAVEVDHLEPVRPRVNEWSPTLMIEPDALDVAAAPLVDDRHAQSFDLVRIEKRLPVLWAVDQRERQDVRMAYQQAQDALCLLLARKIRRLLPFLLVPNPSQPFRRHDGIRPREYRADQTVEGEEIHRMFETILDKQKRVEFLDLLIAQRSGLDRPYWHVPCHREGPLGRSRRLLMIIA